MGLNKIKVAFIGAGYMSTEHIKVFKSFKNVDVCGIFSRTYEKALDLSNEFDIRYVCSSIDELYNSTKADLVIISVPELATKDVVYKCSDYPWVLLIEKPVGYNFEESVMIRDFLKQKKTEAYVAFNRRHYSSTSMALNKLKNDSDKRIIFVQDQEDAKLALKSGQPKKVVENWMFANSIHLIDYFRIFGRGQIIKVENIEKWNPKNPFLVLSKIHFDSGDVGIYKAVWDAPAPWSVTVTTKNQRLFMSPVEKIIHQQYGSRNLINLEIDKNDEIFKPGLKKQAHEILNKILKNKSSFLLPDLDESLFSMELANDIYFK